jgi:hypothetical protein
MAAFSASPSAMPSRFDRRGCAHCAVDHELGAGHKAGIVGGEKDVALGDVVGHAEPANRVARHRPFRDGLDIVGAVGLA